MISEHRSSSTVARRRTGGAARVPGQRVLRGPLVPAGRPEHGPAVRPVGDGGFRTDGDGPRGGCEEIPLNDVAARLRDLWAGARQEALVLASAGSALPRELAPEQLPAGHGNEPFHLRAVLAPELAGWAAEVTRAGGCARGAAELTGYLLVVDRAAAILPIDLADPSGPALLVQTPTVVDALVANFEGRWRGARVERPRPAPGVCLTVAQRRILAEMAAGLTDESIARRLGICSRTVRRHVTGMMDAFGARSRLELGMRVVATGAFAEATAG
jgi:DNA-binding CsgD family transcriptional regulator